MTTVLFPSEPFQPRSLDTAFTAEREAAEAAGLQCSLIDPDAPLVGDVSRPTAAEVSQQAIFRGWMLRPAEYETLWRRALHERMLRLINTPDEYRTCHHLPESYCHLEGRTPKSTWVPIEGKPSREQLRELAAPFGSGSVVIKD